MIKRFFCLILLLTFVLSGCEYSGVGDGAQSEEISNPYIQPNGEHLTAPDGVELKDHSAMDFQFSNRDKKDGYEQKDLRSPTDNGDNYTISSAGVYLFSGDIIDKPIIVSAGDDDKVQIVLDGANISNSTGFAIYISNGDKVFITAMAGTQNYISDGENYEITMDEKNIDGAIYSRADLTLNGSGSLEVRGNNKHGIVSKDDLVITSQTLNVSSESTALEGKDCIKISDACITLNAGGDGMKSDNDEDENRGFVYIESGNIHVTSGNDGIQAERLLRIESADISITSGGGSSQSLTNDGESYKAIKSATDIIISNGKFQLSSKDDAIHANNSAVIYGGEFAISSGDDGMHADNSLAIYGGSIDITKCYEGLEASTVLISDGSISVVASDDGINAAGGNDGSATNGRPGMGMFSNGVGEICISGGTVFIDSKGDGIDSNGTILVSGGITLVSSASSGPDSSVDYDGSAEITGGILIGLGTSEMAMNFSQAQNQGSILYSFGNQGADTPFSLCDSDGNAILTFSPPKSYNTAVVTCPQVAQNSSYTLVAGGNAEGLDDNGFAENAVIENGTVLVQITMETLLYGSGGFGGGMRPGGGGMQPGGGGQRPDFDGNMPDFDGSIPDFGGNMPDFDGSIPDFGGMTPPNRR